MNLLASNARLIHFLVQCRSRSEYIRTVYFCCFDNRNSIEIKRFFAFDIKIKRFLAYPLIFLTASTQLDRIIE